MRSYKFLNLTMTIFFITAISTPLIFINTTQGKISLSENRALANFPNLRNSNNQINVHFINEFENWFNDNLGFRESLVQVNTNLQYSLFGKLTKSDTMIGKDNWLYYVTPDIIKDFQHLNLPSNDQLDEWGNNLKKIDQYLEKRGIPFIFVMNPDKKTIYPENYPDSILKNGTTSRTDILKDHFVNKAKIEFSTPKEALLNAKSQAVVYSPRVDNAHWNNYGAFIGYLELMNRVKSHLPNVHIMSWDDFEIKQYPREVKVYDSLAFNEMDYSFKWKRNGTAIQVPGMLESLNLVYSNQAYRYENSNKTLPKALVFGDSYYYGFLIPQLAQSFSEFTFVHTDNMDKIQTLVNLTKPDIVIYENAERMFDHTMKVLEKSNETFVEYDSYKSLPINEQSTVWVDYANNMPVQQQGTLNINKSSKVVNLIGWAVDSSGGSTASSIFMKVGDKYYPGHYGIERPGVSSSYNNPNLLKSGFNFNVDATEVLNEGKISLIVISKDQSYQYKPVDFKIIAN